jgi:RsiW-degrading membrane proteinase PrsW (M82 family)
MITLIHIVLGVLPSIIWLLFYLREDVHPEPKFQVIKIFLYGMLIAFPTAFLEREIFAIIEQTSLSYFLREILNIFLGVALIEELLKYLVVREAVLRNPEFDEPVDAIFYMIIAALGFAAIENILIFLQLKSFLLGRTLSILGLRFLGATLLHALCSGAIGFWLGLSFLKKGKKKIPFPFFGIGMVVFLHGLYNFSIMKGGWGFLVPVIILSTLALFVSLGFKKLKVREAKIQHSNKA